MAKFIVEIPDDSLEDIRKILENEAGIQPEGPKGILEVLIREAFSSFDYTNPHLDESLIVEQLS